MLFSTHKENRRTRDFDYPVVCSWRTAEGEGSGSADYRHLWPVPYENFGEWSRGDGFEHLFLDGLYSRKPEIESIVASIETENETRPAGSIVLINLDREHESPSCDLGLLSKWFEEELGRHVYPLLSDGGVVVPHGDGKAVVKLDPQALRSSRNASRSPVTGEWNRLEGRGDWYRIVYHANDFRVDFRTTEPLFHAHVEEERATRSVEMRDRSLASNSEFEVDVERWQNRVARDSVMVDQIRPRTWDEAGRNIAARSLRTQRNPDTRLGWSTIDRW